MLGNDQFQLISKALNRSYEQLAGQPEESIGLLSIGTAREDLLQAISHASALEKKLLIQSLYDRY
ncbi:hypothetical protein GKZ89_01755 [Bacillus mangrovi]|uniref:Uncharacterized protein n=1 Tax=Metabacillus mangrovi TaxID=1491830 RepID=A0A7X2S1Q7_9BACI|nr:hypothetical protein [Metabacillus mangrovi]MTH52114.1 hypothetical protein [Metabacillus mangrovi]